VITHPKACVCEFTILFYVRTGFQSAELTATQPMGPWTSFRVSKGDKISAQAFAQYQEDAQDNTGQGFTIFVNTLVNTQNVQVNGGDPPTQSPQNSPLLLQIGIGFNPNPGIPAGLPNAYLKYMFFDVDSNFVSQETKNISNLAELDWEKLDFNFEADRNGFVQVFVANESDARVWFDDLEIEMIESPIIQENHFYPFGMNLIGINKDTEPNNKWQFQGQEIQDDFNLQWSSFKWRNADIQLGRFFSVDPLAEKYLYNSTYAFSENKVTAHRELEGLEKIPFNAVFNRKAMGATRSFGQPNVRGATRNIDSPSIDGNNSRWSYEQRQVIGSNDFVSMNMTQKDCYPTSRSQVEKTGVVAKDGFNNSVRLYNEVEGTEANENTFNEALDLIHGELEEGRAVVAGLDVYEGDRRDNGDGTEHFVAIIGKGSTEDGRNYFIIAENADEIDGMNSEENRLYVDMEKRKIVGKTSLYDPVRVTVIQPNEEPK